MIHITLRDDRNGKTVEDKADAVVLLVIKNDKNGRGRVASMGMQIDPRGALQALTIAVTEMREQLEEHGAEDLEKRAVANAKPFVKESDG